MNKRKRMEAVLENREADQVPSSYWFHYIDIPDVKEKADVHLRFHIRIRDADREGRT